MITLKTKNYTIHELKAMSVALSAAQAAICPPCIECEECINKRVCSDLTTALTFCENAAKERELKYR